MRKFQVPVCDLFREKVISGQLCYEAEINHLRSLGDSEAWKLAVEAGLILIIDTSDEYDVKNLLKKKTPTAVTNKQLKYVDPYRKLADDESFKIMLKSISLSLQF